MNIKALIPLAKANSPAILTGATIIAASGAVILAVKGTKSFENMQKDTKKAYILALGKAYGPAIVMLALSATCCITAQRINMQRQTALLSALALSEKKFGAFRKRTLEILSDEDRKALVEKVQTDAMENEPDEESVVGSGDTWFFETLTGQYFKSTYRDVERGMNDFIRYSLRWDYGSAEHLLNNFELANSVLAGMMGWSSDDLPELIFDSRLMPKSGRPCVVIGYSSRPEVFHELLC